MNNHPSSNVGYQRPPTDSRFKKGQSGNPKGRPKKVPDVNGSIQKVLNRKLRLANSDQKTPVRTALIMKLRDLALPGDRRALALQRSILDQAPAYQRQAKPRVDVAEKVRLIAERLGVPDPIDKRIEKQNE